MLQTSDAAIDILMKETGSRFVDIQSTNYDGVVDNLFEVLDAYMQLRRDFWDLLQEFIKIDADTNNTSNYSSLARSLLDVLRDRGYAIYFRCDYTLS